MKERINYWRRIFKVYLTKEKGYLNFWHEKPAVSKNIDPETLGIYYMTFEDKARYAGPRDKNGVILFDYFADIGRQYNPVAIAQYGLGNFNLYLRTKDKKHLKETLTHADWLVSHLETNEKNVPVWRHHFEWHYKEILPPGWYSALAQGCGISLLMRAYRETRNDMYLKTAEGAFEAMTIEMEQGGVRHTEKDGTVWLEEYMVTPPTHIINGFLWTLWGVWDYWLVTKKPEVKTLFDACIKTLERNLHRYDAGYWSRYDLSRQCMVMLASPFYHALHVVQLEATYILTRKPIFETYRKKFETYQKSWFKRKRAFVYKAIFKLIYF